MSATLTQHHTIGVEPVTAEIRRWHQCSVHRGMPLDEQVTVRRREGQIVQVFNAAFDASALERIARLYHAELVAPVLAVNGVHGEPASMADGLDPDKRTAYIASLLDLAGFLRNNPDVPVPDGLRVQYSVINRYRPDHTMEAATFAARRDRLVQAADAIDTPVEDYETDGGLKVRAVLSRGGWEYVLHASETDKERDERIGGGS